MARVAGPASGMNNEPTAITAPMMKKTKSVMTISLVSFYVETLFFRVISHQADLRSFGNGYTGVFKTTGQIEKIAAIIADAHHAEPSIDVVNCVPDISEKLMSAQSIGFYLRQQ